MNDTDRTSPVKDARPTPEPTQRMKYPQRPEHFRGATPDFSNVTVEVEQRVVGDMCQAQFDASGRLVDLRVNSKPTAE